MSLKLRPLFPRLRESKYRGSETWKPSLAQLSVAQTDEIISKGSYFKPDRLISALTDLSRVSSPSGPALSILASRCSDSSNLFFPPQIIETLTLFSTISFSDPTLFKFLTLRKDDVLNEASPRRLVLLIEALSQLHLPIFHESIWTPIRENLVRVLPELKRGIPNLVRSLASQGCPDSELMHALVKQGELNWKSGEIELSVFVNLIEAASRSSLLRDEVVRLADESKSPRFTDRQSLVLYVASNRVGVDTSRFSLSSLFEDKFNAARSIELLSRLEARLDVPLESAISDSIETFSRDTDYLKKFASFNLDSLSRISTQHDQLISIMLNSMDPVLDLLSGEKLFHVARAARMVKADDSKIKEKLKPLVKQLTVRQSRLLWECGMGNMDNLLPLPPLVPLGKEHLEMDTVVVGPYTLERKKNETTLSLRVPLYQQGDRVIELRRKALEEESGALVTLEYTDF
jgi:hypothetical protein